MAKKTSPFVMNKYEIIYNLLNCGIAFLISFLTGLGVAGNLNKEVVFFSLISGGLVAITKFSQYWEKQKGEYILKNNRKFLFNFI